MNQNVTAISTLITGSAMAVPIEIFMFLSTLVIIFCINVKLSLVAVAILPLQIGTYAVFNKRVGASNWRVRQKMQEVQGAAYELVAGAKVVKSFNAETRASRAFVQDTKEMFGLGLDFRVLSMTWGTTTESLSSIVLPVVSWVSVVRPRIISTTYSFFSASKNWAIRVARPRQSGKTPVAIGSSVPVWPTRFIRARFRTASTTSWDVMPAGLLPFRTPDRSGNRFRATLRPSQHRLSL